jgi:hypothetical protein
MENKVNHKKGDALRKTKSWESLAMGVPDLIYEVESKPQGCYEALSQ